jgi:subtilisin family serine protease
MSQYRPSRAFGLIAIFGLALILCGTITEAFAQRRQETPGRPKGGGGGGWSGGGGLILQLAPGILNELGKSGEKEDDEGEDRPVRRRNPARVNIPQDDDAGDDDNDRPKSRPPSTRTATPRVPPRVVPPAAALGTPPSPFKRAAAFSEKPRFKPGEVVVMVSGADPDAVANGIAQTFNLQIRGSLSFAALEARRVYRFGIPDNRTVDAVVASVATVPGVSYAAANTYYWLQGDARAEVGKMQYALPKMRVSDAQSISRGKGMSVAVIDSGVDAKHPSLKRAKLTFLDTVEEGIAGPDMHGTAIAGIIAASDDMVGIAPAAQIIAVRAFAPLRIGTLPVTTATALATAVDEAFKKGARLYNMSFAGESHPLVLEIIDALYEKGCVFVAAAGNEGPDAPPAYPAAHDKVIAITATDEKDELYEQANRGGYVFAAAPGVDIFAPVTGKGFDYLSGTSFAAAHVTGIVALLMERNPTLTASAVRSALVDAAHDLGEAGNDSAFGAGLADAYGSLMLVKR